MLGQQSVRVTYAQKRRRRIQDASKKLLSSPLEVLPPEMDDLTRTQMARRMLKRSRRIALAEQLEDKNVEHIREHLAKRIKRTQERVSNVEPTGVPLDMNPQDDITFQTPFTSSQSVHESAVTEPLVPEQLSPVPAVKRVMSRTSSRNLKENTVRVQLLRLPNIKTGVDPPVEFCVAPSIQNPVPFQEFYKENTRWLSRKGSTMSLKDTDRKLPARHTKHQRYSSSPSTPYMRSQFTQEDWIAPPKAISRTFYDEEEIPSSGGPVHGNASFYADRPQSCSTPAISRVRKLPDLHGCQTRTGNHLASSSLHKDSTEAGNLDVEMLYGIVSPRRQTIHLSGNSIFSSSDEFTIGSLPTMNNGTSWDKLPAHISRQAAIVAERTQAGHTLAGSFIAEYDIPLSDLAYSPASTAATKILGLEGVPKLSVGVQPFGLPGTSPACGKSLIIRTYRNPGTLTPPSSPPKTTASCPSSPASDLVPGFQSMDIRGMSPK
ncbi:hypothetical protein J3R82DRAFT_8482 [Butyriboletus roseoflavus]|nr:hypothetical protein J3R82DRAFT_8482 [Butyriboletus roseoflavus]